MSVESFKSNVIVFIGTDRYFTVQVMSIMKISLCEIKGNISKLPYIYIVFTTGWHFMLNSLPRAVVRGKMMA